MIAIACKNLSSFFSNPNSFCRSSDAHSFLSIHLYSTSKARRRILTTTPCPKFYDVLSHRHHFSPELASSLASLHLPKLTSPQSVDSVLSFLKENSLTTSQLEKIVKYNPRILGFTLEALQYRLELFRDLELSSEEIAKMMVDNTAILHSSVPNKIIPSLSILKGLLGSTDKVAKLLKRCVWFLTTDLGKSLTCNVEILRSRGIPMERIHRFLYFLPRCLLMKPDIMTKSVDKAIEFGVPQTSVVFIQAVGVFANTSQCTWDVKLQTFRDFGFSDDEIFSVFRKQPSAFSQSQEKLKNVLELLLGKGKYKISDIVSHSASLGYSIEKRLEPRLQILGLLEAKNLIGKRPCLSRTFSCKDDKFLNRFVKPYLDDIGEEDVIKLYAKGKMGMKL